MAQNPKEFEVPITVNGDVSSTGTVSAAGILKSTQSSGDEGGQIDLNKAVSNTTITTGVSIDVFQNKLRFFETGGTNRGYYIDISGGGASVGTNLVGGGSYTLPTASASVLGGVKIGTNVSIDGSGIISVPKFDTVSLTFTGTTGFTTASSQSVSTTGSSTSLTSSLSFALDTGYALLNSNSSQTIAGAKTLSSIITVSNATASTSTTTGALIVTGGLGIGGAANIGGVLYTPSKSYLGTPTPATTTVGNYIIAVSGANNIATLTTNVYHGLAVGDTVTIAGVTPTGYNATNVTVTAVSSATPWTFSYTNATTGSTGFVSGVGIVTTTGLTLNTKSISLNGIAITTDGSTQLNIGGKSGLTYFFGAAIDAVDLYTSNSGGYFRYNGASRLGITSSGTIAASGVYGNTLSTSYRAVYVTSSTAPDTLGYVASSRTMKKNIEPLSYSAESILSIAPVQYHYKTESDTNPKKAGFIAEDLEDAGLHAYISYSEDGATPETINYEFYVSALQVVVRHQDEQIKALTARVEALENK